MICPKCHAERFKPNKSAPIEQEFRGETLKLRSPVMECAKCGFQLLTDEQTDELRRRTADAYREKHGLLTSGQIRAIRDALKMSQRQFAEFLRVGEASVKRWETWQVQEESSDELIRAKWELSSRRKTATPVRIPVSK
jgi:putative zinc finger/helix-turn-helix YgiT family protein